MKTVWKLLCVLAHPDDESLALGGTLAKYAAEGVEVSLVVATRGERGWFRDWSEYPGEQALGRMREMELRRACSALGIARLDFLDYIDGDLDQANPDEAIGKIVRLIRQIQPHVVLTFGPEGLYGHPDHIAISQFTTAAVMRASDPSYSVDSEKLGPHRVAKLYYRVALEPWLQRYMPIFGELVMTIDGQERRAHPWANWIVTTRLDTHAHWRQVLRAIQCHQTQLPHAVARLQRVTEQEHQYLWGSQEYYRVFSLVNSGRQEENDLFEGLRTEEMQAYSRTILELAVQR
jgi:LmbE family N-acetylglucosaminyl deacetylase